MRVVKSVLKIFAFITIIASLFGCIAKNPQVLDKTGMVYKDPDYRTAYANVLEFDN